MSPEQVFEGLIISRRKTLLRSRVGLAIWDVNWETFLEYHIGEMRAHFELLLATQDQASISAFLDRVSDDFLITIFGTVRETS